AALRRLSPLCDEAVRGRNLVPVLVEAGDELIRAFDLDSYRLESIVNAQTDPDMRVERDDIALIAMSSMREEYLVMRMKGGTALPPEGHEQERSLRSYLYDKYIFRSDEGRRHEEAHPAPSSRSAEVYGRLNQRPAA